MGNKITRRRAVIDERYTRPQGLYPCRDVDQRKLRRLILESKLAPCFPGAEEADKDLEECPICFLQYPSLNRSKCCAKGICTECFLQMKAPHASRPTQCPFCKTPCYAVEYRGAKTLEEKGMEQAEEQKVIEAKIRMRRQELQDDEEREQRREEDIRAGRIRLPAPRAQPNHTNHLTAIASIDEMETINWRSRWSSDDHQPQVLATSALEERNTSGMDPYSLWMDGDYQRAGGLDISASGQQSTVSNNRPSVTQHQAETDLSPQFSRGRHREDVFDLDLENIMVMEAIWLSLQEQGARNRSSGAESGQNRRSEALAEISLDSGSDDDPAGPTALLHSVPVAESREPLQGGLVGAIAALAERQVVGGDTTTAAAAAAAAASQPAGPNLRAGELLSEAEGGNQGSRGTEATSSAPSASDAASGESSDAGKVSFEEQMVLAMALSIADAQARVHPGDSRSGPLAHVGL